MSDWNKINAYAYMYVAARQYNYVDSYAENLWKKNLFVFPFHWKGFDTRAQVFNGNQNANKFSFLLVFKWYETRPKNYF